MRINDPIFVLQYVFVFVMVFVLSLAFTFVFVFVFEFNGLVCRRASDKGEGGWSGCG